MGENIKSRTGARAFLGPSESPLFLFSQINGEQRKVPITGSQVAKMNDNSEFHNSDHEDYTFDQHPSSRCDPKSRSPVEIENDKPGKHSKGMGSSSTRLSRKSSKASGKEPKAKRSSPENDDRSHHRREHHDQDNYQSQKSSGPKHEEDFHDSQENNGPKLDQDVFNSQKGTIQKSFHSSRKALVDNQSARNVHHVAFTAEASATQPPAEE